ncbi:MAG: hypothetical protein AAGA57_08400, partial [Planctomycetota bacterium]
MNKNSMISGVWVCLCLLAAPAAAEGDPFGRLDHHQAALDRLAKPVVADFQQNALEDVMQFLSDRTGVPVHVEYATLESLGYSKDTEVTLRLESSDAHVAFRQVLQNVDNGNFPLDFEVADGRVLVGVRDELNRQTAEAHAYPVADLLADPDAAELAAVRRQADRHAERFAELLGSMPAEDESRSSLDFPKEKQERRETRNEAVSHLLLLIEETVGEQTEWGNTATVQEIDGVIVVKAAPSRHFQIGVLFDKLRAAQQLVPAEL